MPVDRTRLKVRGFERRWKRAGEDLCDIISNTFTDGGGTGDTLTPSTAATNIQCIYRPTGRSSQTVVGGETYLASHELELNLTNRLLIKPEARIRVHARTDKSELIFQRPVILESPFTPLVTVAATLVQQGFQQ